MIDSKLSKRNKLKKESTIKTSTQKQQNAPSNLRLMWQVRS
jgi:hypothetical protein